MIALQSYELLPGTFVHKSRPSFSIKRLAVAVTLAFAVLLALSLTLFLWPLNDAVKSRADKPAVGDNGAVATEVS